MATLAPPALFGCSVSTATMIKMFFSQRQHERPSVAPRPPLSGGGGSGSPKRRSRRLTRHPSMAAWDQVALATVDSEILKHGRTPRITKKFAGDRPWLSARELRRRAKEDAREKTSIGEMRHRFSLRAAPQLRRRERHDLEDAVDFAQPREAKMIERVKLPPLSTKHHLQKDTPCMAGDTVRLIVSPQRLKFGSLQATWLNVQGPNSDVVGQVLIGGPRWNGDCLVSFQGQRTWVARGEVSIVVRASASQRRQLTSAQEARATAKRLARDRRKRLQASSVSSIHTAGGSPNLLSIMELAEFSSFFDLLDIPRESQRISLTTVKSRRDLESDELHLLLKKLLQLGRASSSAFVEDIERICGGSDILVPSFFKQWWRRTNARVKESLTVLNDRMRAVRAVFDVVDTTASGFVTSVEMMSLLSRLGHTLNTEELLQIIDAMGAGVSMSFFRHFWKVSGAVRLDSSVRGAMR
jgi:Ca2+-binding EF-hand superfamily protein